MSKAVTITGFSSDITERDISTTCEKIAGSILTIKKFSCFAVVEFESSRLTNQLINLKLNEEPVKVYQRKYRGLNDLKYVLQVSNLPANTQWKDLFNYIKYSGVVDNIFLSIDGTKADIIYTSIGYKKNAKTYLYLVPYTYKDANGETIEVKLEYVEDIDTVDDSNKRKRAQ